MIIRAVHNRDNPYFMVKRRTAQHEKLPARALGVLVYLMSKPNDWEPTIGDLCRRFPDIGKNQAYEIINKLISLGYAQRVEERKNGRFIRWVIEIYEQPINGFGEMENPENQTGPVPEIRELGGDSTFPGNREKGADFRVRITENRKLAPLPENRELHITDCLHEQITEEQQQAENREIAAAANPFNEPQKSCHAFHLIEAFVIATKKHIKNPGALARILCRSGAEDKAIERWLKQQQECSKPEPEAKAKAQEQRLIDDFDWDGWITTCIESGWVLQLENELVQLEKLGGPKPEWEHRVTAYLQQRAANAALKGDQHGDRNISERETDCAANEGETPSISGYEI